MPSPTLHFRLVSFLALALASVGAISAQVIGLEADTDAVSVRARHVAARADGGHDLVVLSHDSRRWMRVDRENRVIADQLLTLDGSLDLTPQGDTLLRSGLVQWLQPGKPPRFSNILMQPTVTRADGMLWAVPLISGQRHLASLDRHGVEFARQIAASDLGQLIDARGDGDNRLWLLGSKSVSTGISFSQQYVVKQFDDRGQRWHWSPDALANQQLRLLDFLPLRAGGMLVVAAREDRSVSPMVTRLHLASISPDGDVRFSRDVPGVPANWNDGPALELVDGRIVVLTTTAATSHMDKIHVHVLDSSGQWQQELAVDDRLVRLSHSSTRSLVAIGDSLFVVAAQAGASNADADGRSYGAHLAQQLLPAERAPIRIAEQRVHSISVRERDALLVVDSGQSILKLEPDGRTSNVSIPESTAPGRSVHASLRVGEGGWIELQSAWGLNARLVRHASDGTVLWRHAFDPEVRDGVAAESAGTTTVLRFGTDLVCATRPQFTSVTATDAWPAMYPHPREHRSTCHELATGAQRFALPDPPSQLYAAGNLLIAISQRIDADGSYVLVRRRFDASGTLVDRVESPPLGWIRFWIDATGTVIAHERIRDALNQAHTWKLPSNSSEWSLASPAVDSSTSFQSLASGDQLLVPYSISNPQGLLTRMRPNGHTRWAVTAPGEVPRWIEVGDSLLGEPPVNVSAGELRRVIALDAATGRERWRSEWLTMPDNSNEMAPFHVGNANIVVRVSSDASAIWVESLRQSDGRRLAFDVYGCSGGCSVLAAEMMSEDALVLLVQDSDIGGHRLRQLRFDGLATSRQPVPIDQAATSGTWVRPGTRSQGMVLDWLAQARQLFAAEFIDQLPGSPSYLDQGWRTLQGEIGADSTAADLGEFTHVGGELASATDARTTATGRARLSMYDCKLALLERETVANGLTRRRTELWQRQSPLLAPCQGGAQATPSSTTGLANVMRIGAGIAGAWADPRHRDQGMMFSIVPPTSTTSGVLFAAWFTYHPGNGAANGTNPATWLTLQGGVEADSDHVELQILRTLGGSTAARALSDTFPIGTAVLDVIDCGSLRLRYQFSDARDAYPFAGQNGELQLERPGACASTQ
jgi:hypothetical protein